MSFRFALISSVSAFVHTLLSAFGVATNDATASTVSQGTVQTAVEHAINNPNASPKDIHDVLISEHTGEFDAPAASDTIDSARATMLHAAINAGVQLFEAAATHGSGSIVQAAEQAAGQALEEAAPVLANAAINEVESLEGKNVPAPTTGNKVDEADVANKNN